MRLKVINIRFQSDLKGEMRADWCIKGDILVVMYKRRKARRVVCVRRSAGRLVCVRKKVQVDWCV